MSAVELSPELRGAKERQLNQESPVRVYPMGFIPGLKHQLLDSLEAKRLRESQDISVIGQELREAINQLKERKTVTDDDIQQFLNTARALDGYVKDGEASSEEEREFLTHALRTDEEIAVIFAKISRNPGSFQDIAKTVTEEGAAKFHQKWVLSIEGYGHASVAEHAIIHMAVENVPSIDGDYITDNRLGSYTEFSARFKGRQGMDYFTPDSVATDSYLAHKWHEVHKLLFQTYEELMAKGLAYVITDEARRKHPARKVLTADGKVFAKQVADQLKNLMPASRLTSIGVTVNAREAESTIRKLLSSPYPSVQLLGALFKEQSRFVSPTLVKYADRNDYLVATRRGIGQLVEEQRYQGYIPEVSEDGNLVDLIEYDERADDKFIAAALYPDSRTGNLRDLLEKIRQMTVDQKKEAVNELLDRLGKWDVPIRALEFPGDYLVEFPGMTYGDWREYKRHRIQSYVAKDLDVRWGYMIPPLAFEMDESEDSQFHGCVEAIKRAEGEVENLFLGVYRFDPYAAHYLVTRLHYRPAIAKFNIREGYHLLDLRTGPTAHPFIRRLMWPLFDQIKAGQPILMDHLRLRLELEDRPTREFRWTF